MTDIDGMTCDLNFFATSHGRNASSGVSGVVKRSMNQESSIGKRTKKFQRVRSEDI